MDVVLTHTRSDFDALGASVAAARLYPGAVPVLQSELDPGVAAFVALHKDALGLVGLDELDVERVRRVIVVDTQSGSRLGPAASLLDRAGVEVVVYDHHPTQAGDLPAGRGRLGQVGAATTLLVAELERRALVPTPLEATAMALGIYADTGNLTFPSTRAADARAIAYLLANGADLGVVARYSQDSLDDEQQALLQALLDVADVESLSGLATLLVGVDWPRDVPGIALVAHRLIALLAPDVCVVVVNLRGKRTQFVARSGTDAIDVRALLGPYDPRGHAQAASAHAKGLPIETALAELRLRLPSLLPAVPSAEDLASAPVRSIGPETPALEAHKRLFQYGHSAFVVMEGSRLVGLVSRRDLDRAIHHGLGHEPVSALMSHRLITATPATPLPELERLMVAHDIGRVPILRGDALVGIVTRTDVLRVLYAHREARRLAVKRQTAELGERLERTWPADWLALVTAIGDVAGDRPLYLVGGAVRDLLLSRANLDLDLVVEGDAIGLAREVARALAGATLHEHPPFGTAKLAWPNGQCVDFASARTEHYTHPGALPTVDFASIKHDLARRDFSVNALALRVNASHFGELLDFFSARADLESGELRVLHNLSFIEDPTRLLRAVRFERQLGFRLEPQSEAFARYAMATGTFDGIGGERNKQELKRIFARPDALEAAKRLADLGAWRLLHPELRPDSATWRLFRRARHLARQWPAGGSISWPLYLAVLLKPLGSAVAATVLERLNSAASERQAVVEALEAVENGLADGIDALGPAALYRRLQPCLPSTLAFLALAADSPRIRRAIWRYWLELQPTRLAVGGSDLKKLGLPPGPLYARILARMLDARLAGEVVTETEQQSLLEQLASDAAKEAI